MVARKIAGSWDDLRFFLAVARTGTLSAAALQTGTEHTTVAAASAPWRACSTRACSTAATSATR